MIIEGKTVYLDTIRINDLAKVMIWKNDEELAERILAYYKPVSLKDVEEWYNRNAADTNQALFGIYAKNTLIGISRLMFIDRVSSHAELGIYIGDRSYQGKGLGREALLLTLYYGFENLQLRKIFLKVDEYNVPAVKVYEKVGMVQEGVLRAHQWVKNSYRNLILFSIFKKDFHFKPEA